MNAQDAEWEFIGRPRHGTEDYMAPTVDELSEYEAEHKEWLRRNG